MRYLISEVEFYEPTVKQFEGRIVVLRRDQLEGEKLYISPKALMSVAASFSGDDNSVAIPNFADIVMYLKAINASFNFNSAESSLSIMCDEEAVELSYNQNWFLMKVQEFGSSARSIYDFLDSLGHHIMVATTLPRTIDINEDLEETSEEEGEELKVEEVETPDVSEEEKEAVIEDSKEPVAEEPANVEVVDDVEELFDK